MPSNRKDDPGCVESDNVSLMATRVSATEAVRAFSDLLNRIRYAARSSWSSEAVCRSAT